MVQISKKFLKNSIIYTVAGTLPMASAILLLPFYLEFLPMGTYGELAIYIAFSMLIQVVVTYSFDSSIYVYFHEYKNDKIKLADFVSTSFIFIACIGFISFLLSALVGAALFELVFSGELLFFPYGLASVGAAVFQACFKVHSSLLQTSEKPVLFFWSNLLSFSLIAGFTVLGLVIYPGSLIGPIGGRLVAACISGIWVLFRIFSVYGFRFNYRLLKTSFAYNNATYIYQIQQWLINYFDRILITIFLTKEAVGAYDFAWKCLLIIDFAIAGLFNSFYPKVISIISEQKVKQSDQVINRYYHGLTAVIMLLVCLCILVFPVLLNAGILESGYTEALQYIPYLAIIYLVRAMRYYFNSPFGALKFVKPLPFIYMGISLLKIGLILIFIKRFELYAIIGATLTSSIVEIFLLRFFIKDRFAFQYNHFKLVIAPVSLGCIIGLTESIPGINLHLKHLGYIALCILILWWFYRYEIKLIRPFDLFK